MAVIRIGTARRNELKISAIVDRNDVWRVVGDKGEVVVAAIGRARIQACDADLVVIARGDPVRGVPVVVTIVEGGRIDQD